MTCGALICRNASSGYPSGWLCILLTICYTTVKAGTPKWTRIEFPEGTSIPPKRTGHTTVTYGDCVYVSVAICSSLEVVLTALFSCSFGGTDGQYHYNDTWCYDTTTTSWTELNCIGYIPLPREGHAATLVDDVFYVFGGRGVDGKDLEDLAAFKITSELFFRVTVALH